MECTKVNCPMQAGTPTDNCGENCPWRTTAKIGDLISRAAAIAEIEEYIEEYSELEPETGYHNLKWCAMEEAKDVLSMLPAVDAIPVDWLDDRANDITRAPLYRRYAQMLMDEWQKEQEVRST